MTYTLWLLELKSLTNLTYIPENSDHEEKILYTINFFSAVHKQNWIKYKKYWDEYKQAWNGCVFKLVSNGVEYIDHR